MLSESITIMESQDEFIIRKSEDEEAGLENGRQAALALDDVG